MIVSLCGPVDVQYHSKISTLRLVSREMRLSSHENHWSVYFGIHYKPLACEKTMNFSRHGEVCPARASGISGIVLHATSRETNVDLTAKSLNGKDEIWTSKTFTKTCIRRWHRLIFLHCSVLASHKYERHLLNGNLLRKTQYYHC